MSGLLGLGVGPPLPYAVGLLGLVAIVAIVLVALQPPVTRGTVYAFAPWTVVAAALHVPYVAGDYPAIVEPLFGPFAVGATTFVLAGTVWTVSTVLALIADNPPRSYRTLGVVGLGLAAALGGYVVLQGGFGGPLRFLWAVGAVVFAEVLAGVIYILLRIRAVDTAEATGSLGSFVVFAHALPGVVTAVRLDVFGVPATDPLVRQLTTLAVGLPLAEFVGTAWPVVIIRVLVATLAVFVIARYIQVHPNRGNLLLGLVAVLGLGPGAHALFLLLLGS